VGQILGAAGRNLVIGAPANLKRWAASHLGAGKPVPVGRRPRTNLVSLASSVAFETTTSPFHQRVVYERLMARYVAPGDRRDLKRPFFLHLDAAERFPRVTVRGLEEGVAPGFGPFRDRGAAEKAKAGLHKLFPLRPCDYTFEPDPALPLGLGCLYAQVRSCAAPCLARIGEDGYRGLAREAVRLLADPAGRPSPQPAWLPAAVAHAGSRALVVATGKAGVELYPVRAGVVMEDARAVVADASGVADAVARLRFPSPDRPGTDWPWLSAWLNSPKGRGSLLTLDDSLQDAALAEVLADRLFPEPEPA
jgi:hypothetical protein